VAKRILDPAAADIESGVPVVACWGFVNARAGVVATGLSSQSSAGEICLETSLVYRICFDYHGEMAY
jgi:hypothetical protein